MWLLWILGILSAVSAIVTWRAYLKTRRPNARLIATVLFLTAVALLIFATTRAPLSP